MGRGLCREKESLLVQLGPVGGWIGGLKLLVSWEVVWSDWCAELY